jgi:hypothetical protein
MITLEREELERRAARVREHLQQTAEELERKSAHPSDTSSERAAEAQLDPDVSISETEALTTSDDASSGQDEQDGQDGLATPERKRLERRADRVRERLVDNVEALEEKAREKLLPIVVTGSALVLLFTVGFAWMFYRTMKLSR